MKFQCILCHSALEASLVELGEGKNCPNCQRRIILPRKPYDPGRLIGGDYLIVSTLGSGGMGTVYLARQISLDRQVAVKVLAKKYSIDHKFRTDFLTEARVAAGLIHNNLVQTYSFGEDDGDLFLAMEYVQGGTLGAKLDEVGGFPPDEALDLIQQIAEGLHYAFTNSQLIHRDLKPDNFILTHDGVVKITDMGLARRQEDLQAVTEISGTPAYMNPEQFLKEPMSCTADIYSLGVCLYRFVCKRLPFESESVRELARAHLYDPVVFDDKKLDLPADLKKLIRKMMAKAKEERHQNYDELLKDIYALRVKLAGDRRDHIPGIHTISFRRREFKSLKNSPDRDRSGTPANPIDSLPRRNILTLKEMTERYARTRQLSAEPARHFSFKVFLLNNLVTLGAVSLAVGAVATATPRPSEHAIQAQLIIEQTQNGDLRPEEAIKRIEDLLKLFPASANAHEQMLRAQLSELRFKLSTAELHETQVRLREKDDDLAAAWAERSRIIREYKDELARMEAELATARLPLQSSQSEAFTASTSLSALPTFWDDALTLNQTWSIYAGNLFMDVSRNAAEWNYADALAALTLARTGIAGAYSDRLDGLDQALRESQLFTDELLNGLPSLTGEVLNIDGRSFVLRRVYLQTYELESSTGATIKLRKLKPRELIDLWRRCRSTATAQRSALSGSDYSFALTQGHFNLAYEINRDDARTELWASAHLATAIYRIRQMLISKDRRRALDGARILRESLTFSLRLSESLRLQLNEILGPQWTTELQASPGTSAPAVIPTSTSPTPKPQGAPQWP